MALGQFFEGQFPAQLAAQSLKGGEGVYRMAAPVAGNACAEACWAFLDAVKQAAVIGVFGFGLVSQPP